MVEKSNKIKVRFLRDDPKTNNLQGSIILMNKEGAEMYLKEGDGLIEIVEDKFYMFKCTSCEAIIKSISDKRVKCSICGSSNLINLNEEKTIDYSEFKKTKDEFIDLCKDKKWNDASELIVRFILDRERIYTTKDDLKSEIWIYKDGIYIPQGRSEIKEMMRKLLGKFYSTWHYNQVIAKIEPDTYISQEEFFNSSDKYELILQNGIFNVITKELKPFNPGKIFFSKLPIKYDKDAKCDRIEQFLDDVLPYDNDKLVYYEIGGFSLVKEYTFEKAFMFVGSGRNGKGKALELIKRVLGIENCASVPLSNLTADNFQISELYGRLVNLAGDISNLDLKETGMFKSLTGRDIVSAKRKFLRDIVFVNHAKFIFACNNLPMVYDTERGFWDRWILLEFPYYFGNQLEIDELKDKSKAKLRDDDIINKITTDEELSGLFNKFLEGLDRLIQNKRFSSSRGTEEIKNLWIRKSNSFVAFCMDNLEEEYDSKINKKELRKKYSEYCKLHKVSSKSDNIIKRTLEDLFGASEDRTTDREGNTIRFWEGIKWKIH